MKITPKWSKTKDEIWNEVFANTVEVKATPEIKHLNFWWYAAAMIAFVITGSSFSFLYTITETVDRGSHLAVILPDGSKVDMNAETELRYKPYWWYISRNVELKGEAYFDVKRGSKFRVTSEQNQVIVLGTSFNIFARPDKYVVTCITGKVEVLANNEKAILLPNMQAYLQNNKFNINNNAYAKQSIDWVYDKFSFIGVPLSEVVAEIERQYDIQIITVSELDYLYTGNFSKENRPQEVLEIIGKPFGITLNIKQ